MLMGLPGVCENHFHLQFTSRLLPSSLNISAHCTWLLKQLGHWRLTPKSYLWVTMEPFELCYLNDRSFFSFWETFSWEKNCLLILIPKSINSLFSSPSFLQGKERETIYFFMDASNKLLQEQELNDSVCLVLHKISVLWQNYNFNSPIVWHNRLCWIKISFGN